MNVGELVWLSSILLVFWMFVIIGLLVGVIRLCCKCVLLVVVKLV